MGDRTGAPNKNKKFLIARLQDMYGKDFDPIMKAAENAVRMQDIASTASDDEFDMRKECVTAWEKIAKYVTPQLKAVEISGELNMPMVLRKNLTGDTKYDISNKDD